MAQIELDVPRGEPANANSKTVPLKSKHSHVKKKILVKLNDCFPTFGFRRGVRSEI